MPDFKQQDIRYARLVDKYSRYIQSPVLRLKFLNSAMNSAPASAPLLRVPLVGSLSDEMLLILELSKFLPPDQPAPIGIRLTSLLYRLRYGVYGVCLLLALSAGAGVGFGAWKLMSSIPARTEAKESAAPVQAAGENPSGAKTVAAIGSEAGLSLDKVWLAEKGEGYEFYSNGARVLTEFETSGAQRRFYRIGLDAIAGGAEEFETHDKPVGIVYHLSEGDLLPFSDNYNSSLQSQSRALVEYARDNRLYNYLIDRFGRTYRLVGDEFSSNHAGNSVWSDGQYVYVNLNASFIGICFEGRSNGGSAVGPDGINEAQIYAARVLTAVLRSRYDISDANCVTHGLVSVNPSNRLMGYHTDWVSGFPFEAMGLSDKLETEMVAISRFGFGYDQGYMAAAGGKRWPGLEKADAALRQATEKSGLSVAEERKQRWHLYQRTVLKQRSLNEERGLGE
ncbi:MAG TPA: peptidoglycan recognition family protein [Blastocatellia bacterium]|nr:peptidoglycan recognition family protein [Blastocatellia bacterium]